MVRLPRLITSGRSRFGLSVADWTVVGLLTGGLLILSLVAYRAPGVVGGHSPDLTSAALPQYALLSLLRMAGAYALSMLFSIYYARAASRSKRASTLLLPVLDVLQSVPILSFLPVVVLACGAVVPEGIAAEIAAVVLIFTSQAWNMTFSYHQSLATQPRELREAVCVMRLDGWTKFKVLEMPHAAIGLIWNSVMSWSAGWYFLMAAESFKVGQRDFRLPGLGSYLAEAVHRGDTGAVVLGLGTLICIIVCLDQFVWRPLLSWADKFRLGGEEGPAPASWFRDVVTDSKLVARFLERVLGPRLEKFDAWARRRAPAAPAAVTGNEPPRARTRALTALCLAAALAGAGFTAHTLAQLGRDAWLALGTGLLCTTGRVTLTLALALGWTVPFGVFIGSRPKLASWVQPVTQVVASIPATALFPLFMIALLTFPGGLNIAAVILMLMATQWYLLFNIIAGVSAVPQELRQTSSMLRLGWWDRWRVLHLPSVFPYVITGAVTACGGAWNASIISERVEVNGRVYSSPGLGSIIADATAGGDNRLLFAATLLLSLTVILINRFLWGRLYRLAEERYRME